jgi:hypothetical protein
MNSKIAALGNGQSLRLGGDAKCWTTVERSGNGKMIRFVRHTPTSFMVFRTVAA